MATGLFDKCCFCIDLRIGCLIIGYLNTIGSVFAIVMAILLIYVAGGEMSSYSPEHQNSAVLLLIIGITFLLIFFLFLTFSIVLLVGLHKRKPGHVKAYLTYSYIFLVLNLISLIVLFVSGMADLPNIAFRVTNLLITTYFVLVVRSYYFEMRDESIRTAPHCNS